MWLPSTHTCSVEWLDWLWWFSTVTRSRTALPSWEPSQLDPCVTWESFRCIVAFFFRFENHTEAFHFACDFHSILLPVWFFIETECKLTHVTEQQTQNVCIERQKYVKLQHNSLLGFSNYSAQHSRSQAPTETRVLMSYKFFIPRYDKQKPC